MNVTERKQGMDPSSYMKTRGREGDYSMCAHQATGIKRDVKHQVS